MTKLAGLVVHCNNLENLAKFEQQLKDYGYSCCNSDIIPDIVCTDITIVGNCYYTSPTNITPRKEKDFDNPTDRDYLRSTLCEKATFWNELEEWLGANLMVDVKLSPINRQEGRLTTTIKMRGSGRIISRKVSIIKENGLGQKMI